VQQGKCDASGGCTNTGPIDCDSTTTTSSICECGQQCVFYDADGTLQEGKCDASGGCTNTGPIDCDSTTTTSSICECGQQCVFYDADGTLQDGKCDASGGCTNVGPIDCDSTTTTSGPCECGEPCWFLDADGTTQGGKCNAAGDCLTSGIIDCDSTTTTTDLATTAERTTTPELAIVHNVTCTLTIDNYLLGIWVGGVDLSDQLTTSCANNWLYACTVTFEDLSHSPGGQVMAVYGDEHDTWPSSGQYCTRSGFAATCSSTDSNSSWNDVKSDADWQTYSAMSPLATTAWSVPSFDDSSWLPAVPTTSGFYCSACGTNGNGDAYEKVWGNGCNDYSYFRRTVASFPTAPLLYADAGVDASASEDEPSTDGQGGENWWIYVVVGVVVCAVVAVAVVVVVRRNTTKHSNDSNNDARDSPPCSGDDEDDNAVAERNLEADMESSAPVTRDMVTELTSSVDELAGV